MEAAILAVHSMDVEPHRGCADLICFNEQCPARVTERSRVVQTVDTRSHRGKLMDAALDWLDQRRSAILVSLILVGWIGCTLWYEAEGWPHRLHWLFQEIRGS